MDWFPYISRIGLIWTSDAFCVTEKWSNGQKKKKIPSLTSMASF